MYQMPDGRLDRHSIYLAGCGFTTWKHARDWATFAVRGTDLRWCHRDHNGAWPLVVHHPANPETLIIVGARSGCGGWGAPPQPERWGRHNIDPADKTDYLPSQKGRCVFVCREVAVEAGHLERYTLLAAEGAFTGRGWTDSMKEAVLRLAALHCEG